MDGPGGLRRFGPLPNLPALHMLLARREKVDELDCAKPGCDDLWQRARRPIVPAWQEPLKLSHESLKPIWDDIWEIHAFRTPRIPM